MDVSENSDTPRSSILIGFFHYKPSILGYHYLWKHPYESTMILGNWKPLGFKEFQVDTTASANDAYESS